jgi:hypothetical protein
VKEKRDLNVSEEDLNSIFSNLKALEKLLLKEPEIYMAIGGGKDSAGSLHAMDLFVSAVINRAIALSKGFALLANAKNYISAVPLIRLQVDNCLRFYASTLVSDYNDFFDKYLSGIHIRNIKDIDGNKMTDNYLARKLDKELFPGVLNLYQNTSGHVHLSNEHSFLQTEIIPDKEMSIRTKIGDIDFFKIDEKVDFAFNMFKATEFLLKMVQSWKYQKVKVESELKKST